MTVGKAPIVPNALNSQVASMVIATEIDLTLASVDLVGKVICVINPFAKRVVIKNMDIVKNPTLAFARLDGVELCVINALLIGNVLKEEPVLIPISVFVMTMLWQMMNLKFVIE